ncbi:release factor glutamine methyltransferase [Rhodopseudomonas rhenobacensis]|uniref:Release factor glutamine methyltransferase n=1 Tax=Rhodopseudomonas rhenobacensis TaxID=87461 RepID=A0A7W8DZ52_9BRAD|nr:release factor glutamine methyltransferase [Rhodopseudomonas rhenobacensis]
MTESFTALTIDAARRAVAARLRQAAIESAELDARLLIGAVLELDLTGLITAAARLLTPDEAAALDALVARRIEGEPVARILGVKEFWGLPLHLSGDTLVPRPDTETIVEAALQSFAGASLPGEPRPAEPLPRLSLQRASGPQRIADLGTGSGAILLALLSEWPDAQGVATDISLDALRTARGNAARLGLADRAGFVACNYASALQGPFDLIVSNPPYIRSADIAALDREVREHDPRRALDGGADGLDAYRTIAQQAAALLAPGGALIVEIGQGQDDEVAALMRSAGLTTDGAPKPDLAGIARAVIGRRPGG